MTSFSISRFAGASPRTGKRLLPEAASAAAVNCKLFSGELRPWRKTKTVESLTMATPPRTLYRMAGDFWLVFEDEVDIVRGPLPGDTDERSYLTGLGKPKVTTKTMVARAKAAGGMLDTFLLGVPAPDAAPTAVPLRGAGGIDSRAYVSTFANSFGEEGPPSPPSPVIDAAPDASVLVSGLQAPDAAAPGESADITRRRIYRTQTPSEGSALWRLVAEIRVEQTSFVDNALDQELGAQLESTEFFPPPEDMQGLVMLPSGVLAGFRGNEICFSEPLYPHAWPMRYRLVTEHPVRALGVYGNTLVAATTAYPYLVTGSDPATMTMSRIPAVRPCMSKRGLVSTEFGVVYPSPDGLYLIGPGGGELISDTAFTRDEWLQLNPESMHAAVHDGRYFAFYENADGPGGLVLDRGEPDAGLTFLETSSQACFSEPESDALFLVEKASDAYNISEWEGADEHMEYQWRSKTFAAKSPVNMAAALVHAEYAPRLSDAEASAYEAERQSLISSNAASIAAKADPRGALAGHAVGAFAVNGDDIRKVPATYIPPKGVTLSIIANDKERFVKEVVAGKPFRLPGGYRAVEWELRLSGDVPVKEVAVAETLEELGARQ